LLPVFDLGQSLLFRRSTDIMHQIQHGIMSQLHTVLISDQLFQVSEVFDRC